MIYIYFYFKIILFNIFKDRLVPMLYAYLYPNEYLRLQSHLFPRHGICMQNESEFLLGLFMLSFRKAFQKTYIGLLVSNSRQMFIRPK